MENLFKFVGRFFLLDSFFFFWPPLPYSSHCGVKRSRVNPTPHQLSTLFNVNSHPKPFSSWQTYQKYRKIFFIGPPRFLLLKKYGYFFPISIVTFILFICIIRFCVFAVFFIITAVPIILRF